MSVGKDQDCEYVVSMKTVTWQKDSHSLFDYEFNKNVIQNTNEFAITNKYSYIYRNHQSKLSPMPACEVTFLQCDNLLMKLQANLQLLGAFQIKDETKKSRIEFYNSTEIRDLHRRNGIIDENAGEAKDEDIYLIVRSLKNKNNENKGYKLSKPASIQRRGRSSSSAGWSTWSPPSTTAPTPRRR